MPYTEKQNRVFRAIEHGWHPDKGSLASISQDEAAKMASEGIKRGVEHAKTMDTVKRAVGKR